MPYFPFFSFTFLNLCGFLEIFPSALLSAALLSLPLYYMIQEGRIVSPSDRSLLVPLPPPLLNRIPPTLSWQTSDRKQFPGSPSPPPSTCFPPSLVFSVRFPSPFFPFIVFPRFKARITPRFLLSSSAFLPPPFLPPPSSYSATRLNFLRAGGTPLLNPPLLLTLRQFFFFSSSEPVCGVLTRFVRSPQARRDCLPFNSICPPTDHAFPSLSPSFFFPFEPLASVCTAALAGPLAITIVDEPRAILSTPPFFPLAPRTFYLAGEDPLPFTTSAPFEACDSSSNPTATPPR